MNAATAEMLLKTAIKAVRDDGFTVFGGDDGEIYLRVADTDGKSDWDVCVSVVGGDFCPDPVPEPPISPTMLELRKIEELINQASKSNDRKEKARFGVEGHARLMKIERGPAGENFEPDERGLYHELIQRMLVEVFEFTPDEADHMRNEPGRYT